MDRVNLFLESQTTDYTFTGQRSRVEAFGLMYYNARWYDPVLGRFAQADSLVPGAGNPMAWDRYAYVMNNPLRFIDPSGHFCVKVGSKHYCSQDDDDESDVGQWLPDDDYPYPWTNPDDLLVEMTEDHGIRVGNSYSESIEWNIDWIKWNVSMIPYEIRCREIECKDCLYQLVGIGVDIFGIVADVELLVTGEPFLNLFATNIEAIYFTAGGLTGNIDIYDTQLYQDQRIADTLAMEPIIGISYSIWGIWLNIYDISQRIIYSVNYGP